MMMMMMMMMIISEAPRVGGAPKLRKCSNLPIRENSVITRPYTERAIAIVRLRQRHTNVKYGNSINRYGNPNATQGFIWKEITWLPGLLERKKSCLFRRYFLFTLTWITEKELERVIENIGD